MFHDIRFHNLIISHFGKSCRLNHSMKQQTRHSVDHHWIKNDDDVSNNALISNDFSLLYPKGIAVNIISVAALHGIFLYYLLWAIELTCIVGIIPISNFVSFEKPNSDENEKPNSDDICYFSNTISTYVQYRRKQFRTLYSILSFRSVRIPEY